jgi:glucose-1-phosphate adenylyltransferase
MGRHSQKTIQKTIHKTPLYREPLANLTTQSDTREIETFQTLQEPDNEVSVKKVLSIILGGGAGTRLYPLTKMRAKPAVPLAGKYRLIDIPVSNCINSEIYKIYVLTQFNSASLNRHLSRTYTFSAFNEGFVEVLAAQRTPENPNWFQGTADAVRQYLWLFKEWNASEFLILSGDHLYRMDYTKFIERHRETNADITISMLPMDEKRASDFGLVKLDSTGRIVDFSEKPKGDALKAMAVDTTTLGLAPEMARQNPYIASMGIYVFKPEVLIDLLKQYPDDTDFGKEIIPAAAQNYNLQAYLFDGYWEDIGTIESFYEANLALTQQPQPPFSFYDEDAPIYTRGRSLPPTKMQNCKISEVMVGDGCILKECEIHHSVLGIRTRIETGCVIHDSLLMGADIYQDSETRQAEIAAGNVPVGIGANSTIRRAIVDKNARIGRDVQIINKDRVEEAERESAGYYIRSGIVVVQKGATIPDGTII